MDKLSQIFDLQRSLNKRIGVDTNEISLDDEQIQQWILKFSIALGQENAELIDSTPWKWWAKYQTFDKQNARVEIVDLLHFVVSLAQVVGMNADDVFELYVKKHKVNQIRQDKGYLIKDHSDTEEL